MRILSLLTVILLAVWPLAARASAATVVPVGRAVGIKLFSDGVVVVGTSEVLTENGKLNPARACGLREGDIITHINEQEVRSVRDLDKIGEEIYAIEGLYPDGRRVTYSLVQPR